MSVSSSPNLVDVFSFPAGIVAPFDTLRLVLSEPCDESEGTRSPCAETVRLEDFSGLRFVAVIGDFRP